MRNVNVKSNTDLFYLYLPIEKLIKSIIKPMTHEELSKVTIEPYTDSCYLSNNTTPSCDIPYDPSKSTLCNRESSVEDIDHNVDINLHTDQSLSRDYKYIMNKEVYQTIRKWEKLKKGNCTINTDNAFVFRLLSFNILAQNLLESHPYLYKEHNWRALSWTIRKPLLLQEILEARANVICLQEMQQEHLSEFLVPFKELGYKYLYKRRTNDKRDGLLFLYRSDQFNLHDYVKVELYRPGIELLSRDNVAIVAKLSLKDSPNTQIVIATTHLLYNPKRNDVRLGQIQLLLAEIERIAFIENTKNGPRYLPIILAGDFNLEPNTAVYRFITEGCFQYYGKGKNLETVEYRGLTNFLLPPWLYITDNCQYLNTLTKRLRGDDSTKLENNEHINKQEEASASCNVIKSVQNKVNVDTREAQTIEIIEGYNATFSSGTLTHPLNVKSVYTHTNVEEEKEATTNQEGWITVDYIFYSNIEPIEKYTLPTITDCAILPTIPNFAIGSDHLCLGASFKILKENMQK